MNIRKYIALFLILSCTLPGSCFAHAPAKSIILIGNPRGLTTAFERYMIKRGDFKVYHEPIVTHRYSLLYPDSFKSPFAADMSEEQIFWQIHNENTRQPFFIKEIARLVVDNEAIIEMVRDGKVQVIFLIRKPEQATLSHFKLRTAAPWVSDFNGPEQEGDYSHIKQLFFKVKQILNKNPILIDADDLLDNPKLVLSKTCAALDIPFDERDLQWEVGESKLWAGDVDSWQFNVTNSRGFKRSAKLHHLEDIPAAQRARVSALIEHNKLVYAELQRYKL